MRIPLIVASTIGYAVAAVGQTAADTASVTAFYRAWSEAAFERGPEGYAAAFAQDAVLLPPNEPPVIGRAAIRQWRRGVQAENGSRTEVDGITTDEVQTLGNVVIYRSTLRGRRTDNTTGGTEPFETTYLDVLSRRGPSWEFRYRMWNANLTTAPEAFGTAPPPQCERAETTAAVRQCYGDALRQADREMALVVARARGRANRPAAVDTAQAAWERLRRFQCIAESSQFEGGSLQPVVATMCRYRLTRRRIRDLGRLFTQP